MSGRCGRTPRSGARTSRAGRAGGGPGRVKGCGSARRHEASSGDTGTRSGVARRGHRSLRIRKDLRTVDSGPGDGQPSTPGAARSVTQVVRVRTSVPYAGRRRLGRTRGGSVAVSAEEPGGAASASVLPLDTTIGHLLRRTQQVHTALWARAFNGDLTGPQYALLSALTEEGAVDQGSAGRLASLDKSTAADVIARLQRNGWLARERDPSDARRNLLSLTAPARAALLQIPPRVADIQRELLEPLAPADRQWFIEALARVAYEGT